MLKIVKFIKSSCFSLSSYVLRIFVCMCLGEGGVKCIRMFVMKCICMFVMKLRYGMFVYMYVCDEAQRSCV
jgi:hypothetical protein